MLESKASFINIIVVFTGCLMYFRMGIMMGRKYGVASCGNCVSNEALGSWFLMLVAWILEGLSLVGHDHGYGV